MNSFEKRNFWLYAVGRLVSLIGSGIQMIAIPLYILDLTGSGTMMGIFTFLNWLPTLAMAPFAGVLGDRWNRKKIMVNMDFARGAIILFLAFMTISNNMSIYVLFVCQVFISLMDSIFVSSTQAMVPELVDENDLMRANSIIGGINSISFIVGPVLGGVIYGFLGIEYVFLINGISFALSAISELFIKYVSSTEFKAKISTKVFFTDFKEGFGFIKSNKSLFTLLIFFCTLNFLMNPAFAVIIPYFMRQVIGFSAQQYGIMQSTFTAGILIGNIILATYLMKRSSKALIKVGLFGMLLINIVFAVTLLPNNVNYFGGPTLIFLIIISIELIIMGGLNALLNTPIQTNFQKLIPNKLRSRVFSVIMVMTQAGVPLGAVLYGVLLDMIPAHSLYLAISLIVVVLSVAFTLVAPAGVYEPEKVNVEVS